MHPYFKQCEECFLVAGSGSGGGSVGSVIPVAGAGDKFAAAPRWNHFYGDGAEGSVAVGIAGVVGQGVLIADVVRHLLTDAVNVVNVLRKVSHAARGRRDFLQNFLGALGLLLALAAEEAD